MTEEKVGEGSRRPPRLRTRAFGNNKKNKNSKANATAKVCITLEKKNTESFNPEDYLLPPDIGCGSAPRRGATTNPTRCMMLWLHPTESAKIDYSVYDDLLSSSSLRMRLPFCELAWIRT